MSPAPSSRRTGFGLHGAHSFTLVAARAALVRQDSGVRSRCCCAMQRFELCPRTLELYQPRFQGNMGCVLLASFSMSFHT
jgi:hypothetical protein